jgi:hypothetical protein
MRSHVKRSLGIPTVADRVAQEVTTNNRSTRRQSSAFWLDVGIEYHGAL